MLFFMTSGEGDQPRISPHDVCFTFSAAYNQKAQIFGIQLHFLMLPQCSCIQGFYIVATKGLDINETNGGKVVIDPIAILAIGEVQDQSYIQTRVIFHNYKQV